MEESIPVRAKQLGKHIVADPRICHGKPTFRVLDENISIHQRQALQGWRIPVRHIGYDIGRQRMTDEEIIPFLHQLSGATFLLPAGISLTGTFAMPAIAWCF